MNNFDGWLNIYKPINLTSYDVLRKLKKFKFSKLGHAGTLDPLAEGILPIALGKATKFISFINENKKEYEFEIKWGEQTDTDDKEGKIIFKSSKIPSINDIEKKIKSLSGKIIQKPPFASAIKINGKRAYDLFRKNEKFEIKSRTVEIFKISIISSKSNKLTKFRLICGKGFYVRSFARDFGHILGTYGHINSLKRTKVGKFTIKNSILLDDLLKISETASVIKGFHTLTSMLDDILAFEIIDEKMLKDISNGMEIKIKDDQISFPLIEGSSRICLLKNNDSVISLGKFDGKFFKPSKVFI